MVALVELRQKMVQLKSLRDLKRSLERLPAHGTLPTKKVVSPDEFDTLPMDFDVFSPPPFHPEAGLVVMRHTCIPTVCSHNGPLQSKCSWNDQFF